MPALEAIRGVAALLVLIYHASANLLNTKYFAFGHPVFVDPLVLGTRGVDIFFVLSGFIIFRAHRSDMGNARRLKIYGLRRLLRIFPVYWAVLAPLLLAYFLNSHWGTPYDREPLNVLKSVFLFPDRLPPAVNDAWTLRHELLFYLLFAGLIWHRLVGGVLLGLWLVAIVLYRVMGPGGWLAEFLLSPFNLEFFFGMAAAHISDRAIGRHGWFLSAGLAGFTILFAFEQFQPLEVWARALCYGTVSAILMVGLTRYRDAAALPRIALYLGRISYPLYIIQPLAIPAASILLAGLGLAGMPALAVAAGLMVACLAAAWLLHVAVEIPSQRFSRRVTSGPKPPPPSVPL